METTRYDVLVVGGGAAGMAAARGAVARGRRVLLVQDGPIGGDCTFTGCVPSKTLIAAAHDGMPFAAAMQRVRATRAKVAATETADVLRGEGIEVWEGRARFLRAFRVDVDGHLVDADRVVLGTGSRPFIPPIEGLADVAYLTNESVFELGEAPTSMVILGGGPVGCELAQALARFGVRVVLVEAADRVLPRDEDEASDIVRRALEASGVEVRCGAPARGAATTGENIRVDIDSAAPALGQRLLVALGRRPDTTELGLEVAGVRTDERGHVVTDDHQRTSVPGVYAAGDVTGQVAFTHAADEMGRVAAANATSRVHRRRFHPEAIPAVTFTDPEVARVGLTMREADPGCRVAELPLTEVDRAVIAGRTDGYIRLIATPRRLLGHAGGGRLVGATVVAPEAGEMVHELALAVRTGMFAGRLAQTVHAYPTYAMGIRVTAAQFVTTVGGRRHRTI